jgi:allantoinase
MRIGMRIIEQLTGERPLGWYTGRDSPNTRRLVADHGGFEYDSDYYGDDLPFWLQVRKSRRQRWRRTWWCPTRWTATTCASRCRRASATATSSSSTCATPSTCTTPKGDPDGGRPVDDEHRHALPAARAARAHAARCSASSTTCSARPRVDLPRIDIARHWKATHPFDANTAFVWE